MIVKDPGMEHRAQIAQRKAGQKENTENKSQPRV